MQKVHRNPRAVEELRRDLMKEVREKGMPITKTLLYKFPKDQRRWEIVTQYMYGHKSLCCPVLDAGTRK